MDKLTDVGAERAVLAGLFQYGVAAYVEIDDILTHSSFGHQNNQILFKCIERILKSEAAVDLPSILSAAEQLKFSDVINTKQELEYIQSLTVFPVKEENVLHFAVQIKKFEFARHIKRLSAKISREIDDIDGSESIDDIINMIEAPLTDFLREDSSSQKPELIGEGIEDYIEYLKEHRCDHIGIASGFPVFDKSIGGGLRRKCVDLVSARPKVGKSVFGDNVALNVAGEGIPVLMIDTEMSKEDHIQRIIANMTEIDINEIATGEIFDDPEKVAKVEAAAQKIKDLPYTYITVAGAPFEQIINSIKRWMLQTVGTDENGRANDCLVVYDYLKLMSSSSISNNLQEYQALGFQITQLHNLAVKYDFACLAFVQLNRDGITKESTDAVSGSDRLIWLCTSFTIFKFKSPEEIVDDGKKNGNRKLVPIVCRHGAGMDDGNYINMQMTGECSDLKELKTRDMLAYERDAGGEIEGSEIPID